MTTQITKGANKTLFLNTFAFTICFAAWMLSHACSSWSAAARTSLQECIASTTSSWAQASFALSWSKSFAQNSKAYWVCLSCSWMECLKFPFHFGGLLGSCSRPHHWFPKGSPWIFLTAVALCQFVTLAPLMACEGVSYRASYTTCTTVHRFVFYLVQRRPTTVHCLNCLDSWSSASCHTFLWAFTVSSVCHGRIVRVHV